MELIEDYLKRIKEVQGIYVLSAYNMTDQDVDYLIRFWNDRMEDKGPLVIIPSESELEYVTTFDFIMAMRMVRQGYKVGRTNSSFYTYLDDEEDVIKEQIMIEGHKPTDYIIDSEDLSAHDWHIVRDGIL